MPETPRHNWDLYRGKTREARVQWLRSLTPEAGLALFAEMHAAAMAVPMSADERDRLERYQWVRKLEARRRMVRAFQALDRHRLKHSADDTGR